MPVRKNQATLSADEKQRFVQAVLQLKANGTYDQFVAIHRDAMMDATMPAHMMSAFLPWHREYLRRLEIELQRIDPGVTIPYWDWTVDRTHNASLWAADFMGGNGEPGSRRVTTGPFAFSTGRWTLTVLSQDAPGPALRRNFGSPASLPTVSRVDTVLRITPYDSPPWMGSSVGFRSALEDIHNGVHPWVGGQGGSMSGPTSPNDPVFFLHHANVDRLWAQWQAQHPDQAGYLPTVGGPQGHNLNDPMSPWGGGATPASVLNHRALGYWYDTEQATSDPGPVDLTLGAPPFQASIGAAGEVDHYRFVAPAAGDFVIETQGPTDVVMTLLGPNDQNAVVAEDDDSGQDRNARLASSLSAGTYYVRVRHYSSAGAGTYSVSVRGQAAAPPVLAVDGPAIQASLDAADESDVFTFSVLTAGLYTIETEGITDTFLTLFGPNSQARLIAQDDDSGRDRNARIVADLAAGVYFARVRHYDRFGAGPYSIRVVTGGN
jgi:tyrosinase